MPRLWTDTIETHRREVRDAILDATGRLVVEEGLLSVTMSRIATSTGIGRATLYKYFGDVEAVLGAWHQREISRHLDLLRQARDRAGTPAERLEAVLEAYAIISRGAHGHHDSDLAEFLHRDERVSKGERALRAMLGDLLREGVKAGEVREDVSPEELASYCLFALAAAKTLPSRAAVRRLVSLTLAGLRPSP